MSKSTTLKRDIRFQQWVQQVQEFNKRPEGMSMTTWCKLHDIPVSTFTTRLHKVQDCCLEKMELTPVISPNPMGIIPVEPAFVEMPAIMSANNNTLLLSVAIQKLKCRKMFRSHFLLS